MIERVPELPLGTNVTPMVLNKLIRKINILSNMSGSNGIRITDSNDGIKIIGQKGTNTSSRIVWGTVVTTLAYADPAADPPNDGIANYSVRLLGVGTAEDWTAGLTYHFGASVILDNIEYNCIYNNPAGHVANVLNKPPNTSFWEQLQQVVPVGIATESESGADYTTAVDFRDYAPWFQTTDIIPMIQKERNSVLEYWIFQTLSYLGSSVNASMRIRETTGRLMAVYA